MSSVAWMFLILLLLVQLPKVSLAALLQDGIDPSSCHRFRHLVVLVHGYLGSDKEQSYLGETLEKKTINNPTRLYSTDPSTSSCHQHEFLIRFSKANVAHTTDGVAKGGERLSLEVRDWILQEEEEPDTTLTLSLIGNSLGGLYSRYAAARLLGGREDSQQKPLPPVLPLVFATTSSPHLGVSNETFVPLQRWIEELVGHALAQTGRDLFWIADDAEAGVGVVQEMCSRREFLHGLSRFQKRIAVANAYNTDFLVSVSSGAFLSKDSRSVHSALGSGSDSDSDTTNLMHNKHIVVQATTQKKDIIASQPTSISTTTPKDCVEALDALGWHKVFLDTRSTLPRFLSFDAPPLPLQSTYSSQELQTHLSRYGTLFPIAHPLNMANSKTNWYGQLTQPGRPIMDALADLLIKDMVRLSEQSWATSSQRRRNPKDLQQPEKKPPQQQRRGPEKEHKEEEEVPPKSDDESRKDNDDIDDESSSTSSSWEDVPSDEESDSGYHTAREEEDDEDNDPPQQHEEL